MAFRKKKPTLTISEKESEGESPYTISKGGAFQEGDINISKTGFSIGTIQTADFDDDDTCIDNPNEEPLQDSIKQMEVDDLQLEDLTTTKVIGRGSGGVVKAVIHKPTGRTMALKVVQLDVTDKVRKQILLELRALYHADSPHIIRFYGAFFSEGHIFIALELMDSGSLHDVLQKTGAMPENIVSKIAQQVLKGLAYLHKDRHLIHRDIKPHNLLINRKGEVKVTDFGVSGQLASTISSCVSWVGTVTYMSPERIQGKSYSTYSDIWSFGLSMLELAIGEFPYQMSMAVDNHVPDADGQNDQLGFWELLDFIVEQPAPKPPTGKFSPEFASFCEACLQKKPDQRPSALELLSHPFIRKYENDPVKLGDYLSKRVGNGILGD